MCEKTNTCLNELLEKIVLLQRKENKEQRLATCDRPFLGEEIRLVEANTRPITLFSCCSSRPWVMPYQINEVALESNIFRCEAVDGNCATFRVLAREDDTLIATESFFTINLNCVSVIQCLEDTFVACI